MRSIALLALLGTVGGCYFGDYHDPCADQYDNSSIGPVLPADFLEVRLDHADAEDERLLALRPVGAPWLKRMDVLRVALSPWLRGQ